MVLNTEQLVEEKAGAPVREGGFWMDSIKTHCYATFDGQAAADRAIAALQGLQWPVQSFKRLEAKIGDISAEEVRAAVGRWCVSNVRSRVDVPVRTCLGSCFYLLCMVYISMSISANVRCSLISIATKNCYCT